MARTTRRITPATTPRRMRVDESMWVLYARGRPLGGVGPRLRGGFGGGAGDSGGNAGDSEGSAGDSEGSAGDSGGYSRWRGAFRHGMARTAEVSGEGVAGCAL